MNKTVTPDTAGLKIDPEISIIHPHCLRPHFVIRRREKRQKDPIRRLNCRATDAAAQPIVEGR